MSLSTRSGLPAYDATTLNQARAERANLLMQSHNSKGVRILIGSSIQM